MAEKSGISNANGEIFDDTLLVVESTVLSAADLSAPIAQIIPSDGQFTSQWHLHNPGNERTDLNIIEVWDEYRGAGILVGGLDDGFDYLHPDIAPNYRTDLDYDAVDNDFDSAPGTSGDNHGTTTSGMIIAALDGSGVVGIAPEAGFVGFRVGFGASGTTSQFVTQLQNMSSVDVVNNSWSYTSLFADNFQSSTFASMAAAIDNAATNGRGGLGTNIVFSAGNSRASGENVNYHNLQNSPDTIAVGATDIDGNIAWFSTPGAAILVSAPGVSIITTDRVGAEGYSSTDFTSISGTSFSAPAVTGVIALMLDANEDLGYRDVQEILAYSAHNPTDSNAGWFTNGAGNWNGGGLLVSDDYGFGLADAHAAVRLAEVWEAQSTKANLATVSGSSAPGIAIVDLATISDQISLSSNLTIDQIQVAIDISHTWIGDLTVTLTSPDGTVSTLVNRPGKDPDSSGFGSSANDIQFTLSSVQFWGESGNGTWTLSVSDAFNADTGTLNSWTLTLLGDTASANDTYIYTDEWARHGGEAGRGTIIDSNGGIDTLNFAAVTADLDLSLAAGGGTTLFGHAITIAAGTAIENAIGGDGDDTIRGTDAANILKGMRGNDRLEGGRGDDLLEGGAGDDTYVYNAGDGNDRFYDTGGDDLIEYHGAGTVTAILRDGDDMVVNLSDLTVLRIVDHFAGAEIERLSGDAFSTINLDGTLIGGDGADVMFGSDDDDVMMAGGGDDTLYGALGNDRLIGGLGGDTLYGGGGNDTYVFERGDGDDLIYDDSWEMVETITLVEVQTTQTEMVWISDGKFGYWTIITRIVTTTEEQSTFENTHVDAGLDTLEFGAGIAIGDILAQQSGQDLRVSVSDPGGGATETIVIQDWFNPINQIETFRFADGTEIDVSQAALVQGILDVDPANQGPVAADDTATVAEDTAQTLLASSLVANDLDMDGDALSITGVSSAVNGTVSLDVNGDVVFTAAADYVGAASFQYTVSDPSGATDVAQVSLTVTAVNDAPRAISLDNASVDENADGAVIGNLAVSDPDAGDSHTFTVSDARFEVVGGQLKLKAGQSLDYETETSVNVGVTATDTGDLSFTQAFVVSVIDDPNDPSEGDDVLVGTAGVDQIDALGGNDRISGLAGADTLHGGLGDDTYVFGRGDGGDLIYDDYRSMQEVTTTVTVYSTVTTTVWVGDSKTGSWQTTTRIVTTTEEQTTIEEVQSDAGLDTLEFGTGIALGDILALQSGQDLLVSVSDPGGGATETITIQDWFNPLNQIETFRFADGTAIDVSQATLRDGVLDIDTANQAPVATDDTATTNQDTALTLLANDLLANDIDSDGDALSLTGVSGAVNGTVSLNANGDVLFTPTAGYVGAASFQYTVSDPLGESDVGQVSLTVTAVNHAPTAISLDGAPVDENVAGAVIGNLAVSDPDAGDSHTFTVSDARFEVVGGQLKLKAGQSLDYEAGATVNVGVTATDTGGLAFTQAFVITVIDDPTDPAGSGGAPGDDVLLGTAGDDRLVGGRGNDTLYGLDGNDTYVFWRGEGDDLIYDDARSMQEVTTTVTLYSTVTTTVWVSDSKTGYWQTTTRIVTTTEEQTSIQEVQTDAGLDTLEFGPGIGVGDILARQSGQDLLVSVSDPGGGAAETIVIQDWFNPLNQIETFRFADGTALDVSQATLRNGILDIDPSNQAPVAADDTATTNEDTALTLLANTLLADDFDPDGDVLSLTGVGGAVNGTVSLDGNGDVVFTPTADFAGAASFQYTVSDPSGATDVAQVSLTVTAVNDAPRAISLDNASVDENADGAVIGNLAVSDPDAGDSHTFTVSDARFEVVGGQLKLKAGQSLDYETATTVNVGVTATDTAGLAFTQAFVVSVIDDPSDPSEGDDVLVGTAGEDQIDALGGNDRITGLAGSDTLHGGLGNDTYVFGRGDGDDLIYDDYRSMEEVTTTVVVYTTVTTTVWVGDSKFGYWQTTTRIVATTQEQTTIEEVQSDAGSDTLEFGTGIALGDILAQQSGQDLLVSVSDPGGGATETVTIQDWFNPMNQVETFSFADGSAIDVSQATLVDGALDLASAGPAVSGAEIVADATDDLFAFGKVEGAPDTGADDPLDPMDFAIVDNSDIPLVSDQDTVGAGGDPQDSGQAETIGVGVPTANPDDFLA